MAIDSLKDLGITEADEKISATLRVAKIDTALQEKLGISLLDMALQLQTALQDRAEEVAADFLVLTPFGDYDKMLEDQPKIAHFLRHQASSPENWKLLYLGESRDPKLPDMIESVFGNSAVDEGEEALTGYVFLNYSGKILHVFVQGDP